MSLLGGLISPLLTQATNAYTGYKTGQKQEEDQGLKSAMAMLALKRQSEQDALKKSLDEANVAHLGAETGALNSGFAGHIFDQDGNAYIVHKDGTLSKATIRTDAPTAAGAPSMPPVASPIPSAPPGVDESVGDSQDMGGGIETPIGRITRESPLTKVPAGGIDTPIGRISQESPLATVRPPQQATPQQTVVPQSGPKFGPRVPPRNIDPNSPEGIRAAAERARLIAMAQIPADSVKSANAAKNQTAFGPKPMVPVVTTDATGAQKVSAFGTRTGDVTDTGVNAKAPNANAQQELTRARAEAAVSEMNNAANAMTEYEKKLADKTANINGLAQFAGSVANTFTHDDPASKAIQSTALAALNRVNPELARYIRRGLSFAEGESMISQRPSDFRTRMAAFLSQAASGAGPEMIGDIQSRRSSIMTPLNRIYPPQGGGRGGGNPTQAPPKQGGTKTPQQLWDDAVKLHGEAKVLQEFGPRPP